MGFGAMGALADKFDSIYSFVVPMLIVMVVVGIWNDVSKGRRKSQEPAQALTQSQVAPGMQGPRLRHLRATPINSAQTDQLHSQDAMVNAENYEQRN
jgi:hypothetical protein